MPSADDQGRHVDDRAVVDAVCVEGPDERHEDRVRHRAEREQGVVVQREDADVGQQDPEVAPEGRGADHDLAGVRRGEEPDRYRDPDVGAGEEARERDRAAG